jgi:hypothetical protein
LAIKINKNPVKIIGVLTALMLCFQNCGSAEFPLTASLNEFANSSSSSGTLLPPVNLDVTMANRVTNCFSNPNYNSCLFWKNPVAMNGAPLPGTIAANSNLSAYQIHAVNIPRSDYDSSGFLKNTSIDVKARNASRVLSRVSTASGNFKYSYGNDSEHRFSQVMAFYWINAQIKYMVQRVGKFFAKDKNIEVFSWYPDLDNAFWDPFNRFVVISSDKVSGAEFSLGAEIYLHEMGHANIAYGTNFAIYNTSNTDTTKECTGIPTATCCKDAMGCLGAIDEGQADYHAAIVFPSNTALGEALVNKVDGFDECGVIRKIDSNVNLTAADAFTKCRAIDPGLDGEVHLMGRVYASVWWEVRKRAAARSADEAKSLDTLFSEHLLVLAASDTFRDALTKIRTIDSQLFANKFSADFENEFARRGITQ